MWAIIYVSISIIKFGIITWIYLIENNKFSEDNYIIMINLKVYFNGSNKKKQCLSMISILSYYILKLLYYKIITRIFIVEIVWKLILLTLEHLWFLWSFNFWKFSKQFSEDEIIYMIIRMIYRINISYALAI